MDLVFKAESGKKRIMIHKVYLAMPKRSTITCRDTEKTKKLALVSNLKSIRIRLESLPFSVPWFIVLSVWVSAVYAKYVSTPIHSVEFPQKKIPFPSKPGFPLSALIILVWYPYVSLIPDLWCYRFECQRFTQNTFQRLYTRSNFHHKPGFPLSALIILVWYPYVFLFPDLSCYRFECQRLPQNTSQHLYTPSNFHKKISSQKTRIPVVHVDNFRLE